VHAREKRETHSPVGGLRGVSESGSRGPVGMYRGICLKPQGGERKSREKSAWRLLKELSSEVVEDGGMNRTMK